MDARLLRWPLHGLLSRRSQCIVTGTVGAQRHESTFRRTKKMLNVRPDSSFLFSGNSPQQDHIVFNPPSSMPSVLHTPLKFIPRDDKRRQILAQAPQSSLGRSSSTLPPPVIKRKSSYQRHHLSEEDVVEMRRLRKDDPVTWSRLKLARKFNCSSIFVGYCCEAPKEKVEAEKAKLEATKARWGPKRKMAREDRVKRKEALYRDE